MNYDQWKNLFLKIQKEKDNKFKIMIPNIQHELSYLKQSGQKIYRKGLFMVMFFKIMYFLKIINFLV